MLTGNYHTSPSANDFVVAKADQESRATTTAKPNLNSREVVSNLSKGKPWYSSGGSEGSRDSRHQHRANIRERRVSYSNNNSQGRVVDEPTHKVVEPVNSRENPADGSPVTEEESGFRPTVATTTDTPVRRQIPVVERKDVNVTLSGDQDYEYYYYYYYDYMYPDEIESNGLENLPRPSYQKKVDSSETQSEAEKDDSDSKPVAMRQKSRKTPKRKLKRRRIPKNKGST